MHIACTTSCIYPYSTRVHNAEQNIFMVFLVLKKVHKIYLKIYRNESEIQAEAGYEATFNLFTYDIRHWTNDWLSTKMPPSNESEVFCPRLRIDGIVMTSMVDSRPFFKGCQK